MEVIEHLPYPKYKAAISEIQRVSRKYIIVSVPNDEDLERKLVHCPKCHTEFNPYRHVRSFAPDKLEHLFEDFEVRNLLEIGPPTTSHGYPVFFVAAYKSWKKPAPPETAICPQCGYSLDHTKKEEPGQEKTNHILRSVIVNVVKLLAKTIWRPREKKKWLLALYEKG